MFLGGPIVNKGNKNDKIKIGSSEDGIIMGMLAVPTLLLAFFFAYSFVVWMTKGKRTWGNLRARSRRSMKYTDGNYSKLPTNTYEFDEVTKDDV